LRDEKETVPCKKWISAKDRPDVGGEEKDGDPQAVCMEMHVQNMMKGLLTI